MQLIRHNQFLCKYTLKYHKLFYNPSKKLEKNTHNLTKLLSSVQ